MNIFGQIKNLFFCHETFQRLSSYVASQILAVAPQAGAKQTVYYISLNSNFEAQRASKILKKL
jgi:hypothetical protein